MFQIGDKVAHPMHGAGVVESIVRKRVSGVTREYYILKLPVRAMVVMIPTEGSGTIGVRPIVDGQEADRILAALPHLPVDTDESWNRRYRQNRAGLRRVDAVTHAAKQILISELVLSKSSSYEAVEEQIDLALG